MDRRRWGFVLVIGVLLLALVVPNVSGRRIAGRSPAALIGGRRSRLPDLDVTVGRPTHLRGPARRCRRRRRGQC